MLNHKQRCNTPLGEILISATDHALTGVWFVDQKYAPATEGFDTKTHSAPVIDSTLEWLSAYFECFGKTPQANGSKGLKKIPKLAPHGTDFQCQVWESLVKIPHGETITYGQFAQSMGKPTAVRAVAAAIGRNPISLLIPCHRVLGANGSLTGYAGGLDRKKRLLAHEALTVQTSLFV